VARGIAAAKIVEIGAGVDAGLFAAADGARIRRELGVGDRLVVGALGKQVERKRYDVLLAAMERVWQPASRLRCCFIAGATGSYTPALLAEVQRINASQPGRVVVLSDFAEADKAEILAAMDVFVLASGLESFGIAFVEAWACRRPVIGVATPAMASLIERGRDGLLTPYGDAAALAECDPDAAGCAGAAAGAGRGGPCQSAPPLHVGCRGGYSAGSVQPCTFAPVGAVTTRLSTP
jgi:glycosyltransferase involved in cell wall biosynthesis